MIELLAMLKGILMILLYMIGILTALFAVLLLAIVVIKVWQGRR